MKIVQISLHVTLIVKVTNEVDNEPQKKTGHQYADISDFISAFHATKVRMSGFVAG